jgi:hypothetical protein
MKTNQVLGQLLLIQAKKLLAAQGVELRCQHEITPYDSGFQFEKPFRYDVVTLEKYYQPETQADIEREMIKAQLDLFLYDMGAV